MQYSRGMSKAPAIAVSAPAKSRQKTAPAPQAVLFDAYGTLFDVYSVALLAEQLFPGQGQALSVLWRDKQIEYTRLVTTSNHGAHYRPFWELTRAALVFAIKKLVPHADSTRADAGFGTQVEQLMNQYRCLSAFPENRDVLQALKSQGVPTGILSNGDTAMLTLGTDYTYAFEAKDIQNHVATGTALTAVDAPDIIPAISGKVTKPDGTPIAAVSIEVKQGQTVMTSTTSGVDGTYSILNLPAGPLSIYASANTLEGLISSAFQPAVLLTKDVNFTISVAYALGAISGVLPPAYAVKLAQAKAPGLAPDIGHRGLKIELWQGERKLMEVEADPNGNFTIPNLLSGQYTAKALYQGIPIGAKPITLRQGSRATVEFEVPGLPPESVYNYPNPTDGTTTFKFSSGYDLLKAEIKIYTLAGEVVRILSDGEFDKSQMPVYRCRWDGANTEGSQVASGVYLYMVIVKDLSTGRVEKVIKKLAVIK